MITKMSTSFRPLPNLHRRAIHSMHKKHRKDSLSRRGIHGILMEGRSSFSVAKTLSSSSPICTIEGMYSDPINYRNLNNLGRKRFTRLFGSKRGVPGNPIGTVAIYNEQETLQDIDEAAIERTVKRISKLLGYETYDVTLLLVDDEEMRETNLESRGIDSPTDILSFPFHMCRENQPGVLEDPEFDIPDYYTLGDMVICVPYVIRRCEEDALIFNEKQVLDGTTDGRTVDDDGSECEDDESDLCDDDDRGVSGAMAGVSDPERRIRMLLIHGMLHLVGYDHIEDDDYIEMVAREEELLRELGEL